MSGGGSEEGAEVIKCFLRLWSTAWATSCGFTWGLPGHALEAFTREDAFLIHGLPDASQVVFGNPFLQPHMVDSASFVGR